MDEITLRNKIAAAHFQGWSEGYIEGLKAAFEYVENNAAYVDDKLIADLKLTIKLCGGDIK